ncbi:MAG: glycerol dehydrogenase [Candidatus Cloacimonadaceae bacterium]
MRVKAVFPGHYIQGCGVIGELPDLIDKLGNRALLLASKSVISGIISGYPDVFSLRNISVDMFNGECCHKELDRINGKIRDLGIDVMIGMGGGKVIDTAKICADNTGIPVIVIPTIASTDAPCSGCAVVYRENGVFEEVLYQKSNPTVVMVDLDIIAASPHRFIVSGMGDALATWFEARSCYRTMSMNECGGHSTGAGMNIARLCYDSLLEYGLMAKIANENSLVSPALEYIVEANILLSGIGFESCGIACAHAVHNGLTILQESHDYYHGEKVAFGVLTGLHLTGSSKEEIDEVYSFCESIGLPTTLADIGLDYRDRMQLQKVAIETCKPGSSIYNEASQINPDTVLNAILMADATGRQRRKKA